MNPMNDNTSSENINSVKSARKHCLFCHIPKGRILVENDLAYAISDKFPVTDHHSLIIPKRHVASYFDLTPLEVESVHQLMGELKQEIEGVDPLVTGFNIGINCGNDAGQTIFHCHIHLIPRRRGDVENPLGGVRHVIPGKGYYKINP